MQGNKGFTVIELLIVVAIILIIAAIAYPNIVQSYAVVNEAEAVTSLRKYAAAQKEFRQRGQTDAYADNFRNLYYFPATGADGHLALIPKELADAAARENPGGTATAGERTPPGEIKALQGYFFREPANYSGSENAEKFRDGFALLALPADSSRGGRHAFWIDAEEKIWARTLPEGLVYVPASDPVAGLDDLETPDMGPAAQAKWEVR